MMKDGGYMTSKAFKLIGIIILSQVLFIIVLGVVSNNGNATNAGEHMKALAPYVFLFGLVVPIVFITQFHHRQIYKYLGIFLVIVRILSLITTYTFEFSIYPYLGLMVSIISVVGLLVYAVIAFTREEVPMLGIYLLLGSLHSFLVASVIFLSSLLTDRCL